MNKRFLIMTAAALFALGVACGEEPPDDDNGAGGAGGTAGTGPGGSGGSGDGGSGGSGTGGSGGGGAGGSGTGGSGGSTGTGGSGGSNGTGGAPGWQPGPACLSAHVSRLRDVSYQAIMNSGFYEADYYRELEDGEFIEMEAVGSVENSLTFVAKGTEWPEEGDPPVQYRVEFPKNLQAGAFKRKERVDLVQEGNWTILYGTPNTVALYRFESLEGVPRGYDASLPMGEMGINFSMETFCEFESECTVNPRLLQLVAEHDGETLVLYDFEEHGTSGSWTGQLGSWTISNDALGYMTGAYCDEETRQNIPQCGNVPEDAWTCHQPYFSQVITAVMRL